MTTIRSALAEARASLQAAENPALESQALLSHVLDVERTFLFTRPEHALTAAQYRRYESMLKRRAAGVPLAYIIGWRGFYDIELLVTPAVLIPRPETELLLEEALRLSDDQSDLAFADIGTGSGALAISFARRRPAASVYATDISGDALQIARMNAERNGVQIEFLQGDLAEPLIKRGLQVDLLLANLPYIASDELGSLAVSRYEPRLALDGGADGLALIRRLLRQLPDVCAAGAIVLLEIGAGQGEAVVELARESLGAECDIQPDYAGLDRIARLQV